MTVTTKAKVKLLLEVDAGVNVWNDAEPGLRRAFEEARDAATNRVCRVLDGQANKGDREGIRVLSIEAVDLNVSQEKG